MSYAGKIYSGDGHIDLPWLPADLFVANAPAHLKDQMPKVEESDDGRQWFAEGRPLGVWVAGAGLGLRDGAFFDPYVPGHSKRLDKMEAHRFSPTATRAGFTRPPPICVSRTRNSTVSPVR